MVQGGVASLLLSSGESNDGTNRDDKAVPERE